MDKIRAAQLVLRHRANLRKIWLALAIAIGGLGSMLYYILADHPATDPAHSVAYFGISAVTVASLWFAGRLGKENLAIQRELREDE